MRLFFKITNPFIFTCLILGFTVQGFSAVPLTSFLKIERPIADSNKDTVEITASDFAKDGHFNGNHATVFGIALGNGRLGAKAKLAAYPFLKIQEDAFNPRRFYLYEQKSDTSKTFLAYLIWPNYDSGLYQIIIYPAMAKYMKGLSADIVSPACIDNGSDIYKFLGEPTNRQVTVDKPNIKIKTTLLYYPKWNMVIEESKNPSGTTYNLMLTHKW